MNDEQLLRYSRHIMLSQIDIAAQEQWLNSRAFIIGLGGLGSPAAMYLASAGVGTLVLVDDDIVDRTNLQRQIIHRESNVGLSKVESAAQTLREINGDIQLELHAKRLAGAELEALVASVDIVLDCSDNFATRFALNRACVSAKVPLVSGAAIRFDGQISVFDPRKEDSPCYNCLYREGDEEQLTCSEAGIFAPLVGIVGATQAAEALKVLGQVGEPLTGRLLLLDGLTMQWRSLKLRQDSACPVCHGKAS